MVDYLYVAKFDVRFDQQLTDNEIVPRWCISIALPKTDISRTFSLCSRKFGNTIHQTL
jgi:hypothetical protein